MQKLLKVKNLTVSYHTYAGEVHSVREVNFEIHEGETVAIVGKSGCGKTVTAKSLMRLIQTPPGEIKTGSEINFMGTDVLKMSREELRNFRGGKISMIFQDPMTSLNPTMTIGKQITESLLIHKKISKKEAMDEAIKLLKLVRIADAEKRVRQYPHEFSGGMRQRVMIAIALACSPRILIADEPTTALDVTVQAQIMSLLKEIQNKLGTAVLMITHDLGIVADVADRILVMYSGKIIECGTTDEIFYFPQHPYTWSLLQSIPRLQTEHKGVLYSIHGTPPDLLKPPDGCPFATRCEYAMAACKKAMPEAVELSGTHRVRCWLKHPNAPKVQPPAGIGDDAN